MNSEGQKKLDRVMRLPEIAVSLGVCERSVRRMTDRGELPRLVRVGRAVGLMQSDIEAFLERNAARKRTNTWANLSPCLETLGLGTLGTIRANRWFAGRGSPFSRIARRLSGPGPRFPNASRWCQNPDVARTA